MTRWFVSDHHLDHYNIIRFAGRPFTSTKEMNEFLLDIHNKYVKPEDHVSFLGDVTLRRGGRIDKEWFVEEIRKYHGHKRLFLGNHDHFPIEVYLRAGFEKIYATWRDESRIIYSHIPLHPRQLFSALANVHGHIHQNKSPEPAMFVGKDGRVRSVPYVNVSVEAIDYRPVAHEELMDMIKRTVTEWDGAKVGEEIKPKVPFDPEAEIKGGEDS